MIFEVEVVNRKSGKVAARVTASDGTEIETAALYLESEYRSLLSGDPPSHVLTITRAGEFIAPFDIPR